MMVKTATRSTLHRALTALPYDDLKILAEQHHIDLLQNRTSIEYALLAQDYPSIARKTLTMLRKAFDKERV
jgi:hypothetical protein